MVAPRPPQEPPRCPWAMRGAAGEHLLQDYHDREWGVPLCDDRALFELLCLEGAQAGLSWQIVLRRREAYRSAFLGFDIASCAALDDSAMERLTGDARLIRHRGKIAAVRTNARAALSLIARAGSLRAALWGLAGGAAQHNAWTSGADVPASTEQSQAMSRALRQAGFVFVGPTICYAFMQACGMVNDHLTTCFRHAELRAGADHPRPGPMSRAACPSRPHHAR